MDGRAVRWKRHNDDRRKRIVDAAIGLIEVEGASISLQSIGEAAGLSRSVVYRHFADRRELDLAIQADILAGLWARLLPAMELTGSMRQIIARTVGAYVNWALEHPLLHKVADVDTAPNGSGPLQQGLDRIAVRIRELILTAFELAQVEVSEVDKKAIDPLIYGLIGMVFGAVRRWVHLDERIPDAKHLTDVVTECILAMIDTRTVAYGLTVDHDQPLEELFG
ncbi:TetR family transcriptional regulator [Nocardioides albertanoniae]|uniref:TetR family transcriptional regulator n=1 Tax=Nocardioides albertanoniae TaxID=1175486 RepID=A0A543ADZ2_9ACTN|nr:TetR/AcrR family transcriptional regulator [Nocardioides albertanoniae]TQL70798.1 TetR family transcriptional regulator [Nocardioides albertanoniae]